MSDTTLISKKITLLTDTFHLLEEMTQSVTFLEKTIESLGLNLSKLNEEYPRMVVTDSSWLKNGSDIPT